MSDLLPHIVRHAVTEKSVFGASQSFGVVTLVVVVVILVEAEALRVGGFPPRRLAWVVVFAAPLLVALVLTVAARLAYVVS